MKVALITGITGQDGSYLAELLLEKGYEVHGIVRRASLINTHRIDHIYDRINLHYGDLTDSTNLVRVIKQVRPDEIYNLGAQSHVKSVCWAWKIRFVSIRHLLLRCLVKFKKSHKQKPHPFTQGLLMGVPKFMDIGSSRTIVKHMECTAVLVFCSIMSHQDVVKLL